MGELMTFVTEVEVPVAVMGPATVGQVACGAARLFVPITW